MFSFAEIKLVAANLANALQYLHNMPKKIIHRDVKVSPTNFLYWLK